jgi:hypothetical protein
MLGDASAWIGSVDTAADGAFEIRGPAGLESLRLAGFAREHESATLDIAAGDEVVLRLEHEVVLAARVLLEPDFPRRLLHFLLVSADGDAEEGELQDLEAVRFRHLRPAPTAPGPRWRTRGDEQVDGLQVGDRKARFSWPATPARPP